jgi:hypothetical protein
MSIRTKIGSPSSTVTSETPAEQVQTLVFGPDGKITSNWVVPEAIPILCSICGKRCKELRKPLCTNANPYCG